ncbi:MAG: type III PLP-dependent enzyme, partial [Alphaproteobacteria bacterium]
ALVAALQPGYPVYCLKPAVLARAARRFLDGFPGRVMYAVKCNPHPLVLRAFWQAGLRDFDTASLAEIAAVRELGPEAGCYYMHPVKSRTSILTAHAVYGVRHFVIDDPQELAKILDETDRPEELAILVRMATPTAKARYELSRKFGARPDAAAALMRSVHAAGCATGLAFHVGSQCLTPEAYGDGLALAGQVIADAGVPVRHLDVGGGFPASYIGEEPPPLDAYFDAVRAGLEAIRLPADCTVWCEPGRALVAAGCSLLVQVQLVRDDAVFINDGVYHSLSEAITGQLRHPARLLRPGETASTTMRDYTVFGPTCDSTDLLPYRMPLPDDVREGDWIEISDVGAYSNALATHFNGVYPDTFVTVG